MIALHKYTQYANHSNVFFEYIFFLNCMQKSDGKCRNFSLTYIDPFDVFDFVRMKSMYRLDHYVHCSITPAPSHSTSTWILSIVAQNSMNFLILSSQFDDTFSVVCYDLLRVFWRFSLSFEKGAVFRFIYLIHSWCMCTRASNVTCDT